MYVENPKPHLFMTIEVEVAAMLLTKGLALDSVEYHEESKKSLFFFSDLTTACDLIRRIKNDQVDGSFSDLYRNRSIILSMSRTERESVTNPS